MDIAERVIGAKIKGWGMSELEIPHYSTNPIASQVLKDHMREAGWFYAIQYRSFDCLFSVCFYKTSGLHGIYVINNNELRAVAEAALSLFTK